ncbi:MAG: ABC transporter permease [Candidatus Levybacteria bacterium]|nr:ABC transporter permease [Candidatus Levybacteria bacterium]
MSLTRIKGMILQELFITKRSLEVFFDIFFFSLMTTIVFGLVSVYLTSKINPSSAHFLFIGILLMEIIRIAQYSTSTGVLWNIWARNLSNLFISPLSITEYMIAQMLSGTIKSLFTFSLISMLAAVLFNFNILNVGLLNLFLFYINLVIFAWSFGIFVLGLIFRYGTRIQSLAWGLIFVIQPLTAAFFPIEVLPKPIQSISNLLPPTHIFEAARGNLINPSTNWAQLGIASFENIILFILSLYFFKIMFNKSKETGQFARNEG